MANLFDLYTFTPPTESPQMMSSLVPTGLDSIDTDLSVDLKLTPAQNLSSKEMFEQALSNVGKGKANAPLYTYGDKEARRYDIPSMQYTPGKTIIGTDIEDMYSKNQEWYKKLGNGVLKGVAFAGGTFASSFLTIPSTVDLVRQGNYSQAFNDDGLFPWIQESLTNLEDTLPNYYTEWERDHPYLSAVPFMGGAANFWGDKVIKNIGFSVGAIGAGIVQSAAIEAFTAGTGTPLAALRIGQALKSAIPGMFRGFRNLTKVAQSANAVQDMTSMTRMGNNIAKSIETAALAANLTKSAKFLTTTYLSAQGEAFIEGYHTYLDVKNNFYKQLLNNELTPAQAGEIEQTAQDAGRLTTNINLALLMFSNAVQFPRLLGATPKNEFVEAFTKVITKEGGIQYAKNYSKKKAAYLVGKEWVKDSFMEGAEEFGQAVTGNSVIDYHMDKFSPAREGALYYIRKQLENDELYQEAFLGAISGFLMGGYAPFSRNFVNVDNRLSKAVDQMNSTLRKFDNATRLISSSISTDEAGLIKEHEEFKAKFNMVNMAKTTGTYDMLLDHLKDSADLPIEEFNKLFNTELKNDADKALKINELMREMDDYAYIIDKVNQTYSENPYQTDNVLIKKLKNAFGDLDTLNLERTQAYLYEEWKSTMAYTIARSQNVGSQLTDIKEAMSSYGYSPQSHEFLKGIARGSRTTVKEYTAYKNAQINAALQEVAYLKQQQEIADASSPAGAKPSDYQRKIHEVNKRREEIQEVVKKVEALSKGLSVAVTEEQALVDKDKREELLKILIEEEFSILNYLTEDQPKPKPDDAVKEDVEKKTKEAVQLDKEQEGLNKTLENPNKTAEQLVDVEQANTEEIPGPKVTVPIELDENSWKKELEPGDIITIKINNKDIDFTVTKVDPNLDSVTLMSKSGLMYELRKLKDQTYILSTDLEDSAGKERAAASSTLFNTGFKIGEFGKLQLKVNTITIAPREVRKKEEFLNNLDSFIGKEITINNRTGILNKINESRYELEFNNTIYEFEKQEVRTYRIPESTVVTSKYKVEFISENQVIVNEIPYIINTSLNGNIESLSPENKPEQKIKNESLLIAVEIERSKYEYQSTSEYEDAQILDELKSSFPDVDLLLNTIWEFNLTDIITTALDKLYNGEPLTKTEQLQTALWLTDVFDRITKLIKTKNPKEINDVLLQAYNTAEIINGLLYELNDITLNKNGKQKIQTTSTQQVKNNVNSKKSKKQVEEEFTESKSESESESIAQEETTTPFEEQPSVLSTYNISKNIFTVTQAQHENKIFVPFNFSINALKRDSIQGYIYTDGKWYAIRINKDGQTTTPILRNPPGNLKQLIRKIGDNYEEELKPVTIEEMEAPTDEQPAITDTDRFLGVDGTPKQKTLLISLQNLNLIKINCP